MRDSATSSAFGEALRSLRLSAGLTQRALAERSGVARRTIQDLERGVGRPQRQSVSRLISVLRPPPETAAQLDRATSAPRGRARRQSEANHNPALAHGPTQDGGNPVTRTPGERLPIPLTTFVGRERQLAEITSLLAERRLLTLTGPGGSGKTRLALEVAARLESTYRDGVYRVSLAPLADPVLVASNIVDVLAIQEAPNQPAEVSLELSIGARQLLLLLDNFEHLLPGAPLIVRLLMACPRLSVLVTSREVLRLSGEHVYPVPPLTVPDLAAVNSSGDVVASASASEAVRLFVDRAQSADAGFRLDRDGALAVAELCVRLDGLPLAVEIAAARSRLLSPRAMVARMERRLPLLTGGPRDLPARQRTLRDTIAWSYDLLDEAEQCLFRTISVFAGGCTLAAVEAVSGLPALAGPGTEAVTETGLLDDLASLVDKSLVRRVDDPDGEPRFMMLETLREFGTEQLTARGELPALRDRHLAHYLACAETAQAQLQGPLQALWFDRLERENDNLRSALEWSSTDGALVELPGTNTAPATPRFGLGIRLAAALGFYWVLRGRGRENLPRVMALVALARPGTFERARAVTVAAHVQGHMLGDYQTAIPFADEGVATWRALGDADGIAVALLRRGQLAFETGDYPLATTLLTEAQARFRELGKDAGPEVPTACWIAEVAQAQGDLGRAERIYDEVLPAARARGDSHVIAHSLREIARLRRRQGDPAYALTLLRESAVLYVPIKDVRCACILLEDLAGALCECGRPTDAARLFGAAVVLREIIGKPLTRAQHVTHDRDVATVKRQLGPDAFAAAWSEGNAMSWEQAIVYVTQMDDSPNDGDSSRQYPIGSVASSPRTSLADWPQLTPRQTDVARLLARGFSNRQIAAALIIEERTVHSHVYRVLGKLGLSSRAQVAAWAVAHGLDI